MFKFLFAFFICFFVLECNAGVVPFIKPCKVDDKPCLVSSGQAAVPFLTAGIPELGFAGIEPLKIESVQSNDNGLKLEFRNVVIEGSSKAKIRSIERDPQKHSIKLNLVTPLLVKGQYDLNGKLLILEATGNGPFEIKTKNVAVDVILKYKTIEKNSKQYWKITDFDYTYDLIEKFHIKLDNLFGGNKQLADPVNELLDKEWKLMITEVGRKLVHDIIEKCVISINDFFSRAPVNELEIA